MGEKQQLVPNTPERMSLRKEIAWHRLERSKGWEHTFIEDLATLRHDHTMAEGAWLRRYESTERRIQRQRELVKEAQAAFDKEE